MGLRLASLIAATNANDAGAEYIRTGRFAPRNAVQTYANAMDVGNPSNLARLRAHFGDNLPRLQQRIAASSVSDSATIDEIRLTYEQCGTVIDPHTAVGVAVARAQHGKAPVVVTATAHPAKFPEVIERALGRPVPLPPELRDAEGRAKQSTIIPADYAAFKRILLTSSRP
jgi:threonine synthase